MNLFRIGRFYHVGIADFGGRILRETQLLCLRPLLVVMLVALSCLVSVGAKAADYEYLEHTPSLLDRLSPDVMAAVFPNAGRIELLDDGGPPAVAVYRGEELAGYVFSTLDVLRAPGYDGTPFDVIAGVDLAGKITGSVDLFHHEPLLIGNQRLTDLLADFLTRTPGMGSRMGSVDGPRPGFVVGATTTARAMRTAIRDGARTVLSFRQDVPEVTEPTLNLQAFQAMTPDELLKDGSIVSLTITNADLAAAMEKAGAADLKPEVLPKGGPADVYIQLRAGLATPAMIGRNAAGPAFHDQLLAAFPSGSQGIFLASSGPYDFQGFKFQNASTGYKLERIRILQGDHTYEFDKFHYMKAGILLGTSGGIVVLPPDSGFDPLAPWRVEMLVTAHGADGQSSVVALPPLDYVLPARHILMPEPEPLPAWMEAWTDSAPQIAILGGALVVLTLLLAFQSRLTRYRLAHRWLRIGFLVFTLVWIGWIAGAQLSITHLINYLRAPFESLDIGFYLAEPLIVIISVYVAISLVLLGRGVFCGWLCPFGAFQELLGQLGRLLKLPQWNPSDRLQSKLWWGKYVSVVVVVGLAFLAPTAGSVAADIEPFKTAISSHFDRAWPYLVYALILLGASLFTERAFCRFLCPLGGALAILDRLHLLNLLKRRPECGSPCHLCERSCPVKAIRPSGEIVMAECFQCLDCQVEYYDDHRCPPLAQQRKSRERAGSARPRPVPAVARSAAAR